MRQLRALLFDSNYGQAILVRSVGQSAGFWLRYVGAAFGIYILVAVAVVVYYTPQLPTWAQKNLSSQPAIFGSPSAAMIIDTTGSVANLDKYPAGYLFTKTEVVVKTPDGRVDRQAYPGGAELDFSIGDLVDWLKKHQPTVLVLGMAAAALLICLLGLTYALMLTAIIFTASGIATLIFRKTNFTNSCKLGFHAAVPVLVLNAITLFVPDLFSVVISVCLFGYYYFTWVKNFPLHTLSR